MRPRPFLSLVVATMIVSLNVSCKKEESLDPQFLDGYWRSTVSIIDETRSSDAGARFFDTARGICTFYRAIDGSVMSYYFRIDGNRLVYYWNENIIAQYDIWLDGSIMVQKQEAFGHRVEIHFIHVARNLVGTWDIIWVGKNDGEASITQRYTFNAGGSGTYGSSRSIAWRMGELPHTYFPLVIEIPSSNDSKYVEISSVSLNHMWGMDDSGREVLFNRVI